MNNRKFNELLQKVERKLQSEANYISTVSPIERADAEQELRIAVWRAAQNFDASKGAKDTTFAIAYLKTETKRIITESYRNFKNTISLNEEWDIAEERVSIELNAERAVIVDQINQKLSARRGKHALAVFAMALEGYRLVDIANELKLAYSWVKRVWDTQIVPVANEVRCCY